MIKDNNDYLADSIVICIYSSNRGFLEHRLHKTEEAEHCLCFSNQYFIILNVRQMPVG